MLKNTSEQINKHKQCSIKLVYYAALSILQKWISKTDL